MWDFLTIAIPATIAAGATIGVIQGVNWYLRWHVTPYEHDDFD